MVVGVMVLGQLLTRILLAAHAGDRLAAARRILRDVPLIDGYVHFAFHFLSSRPRKMIFYLKGPFFRMNQNICLNELKYFLDRD